MTRAMPYFIDQFRELPLEQKYKERTHHFSISYQIGMATLINILTLSIPIMMLQVYDRVIPHNSMATLLVLSVSVATALMIEAILRMIRSYLTSWTSSSHEHATSCAIIDRISDADITEIEKTQPGEHLQNISAVGRLREFYSGQPLAAVIDLPFAALFLSMIAYIGGVLVLVPIAILTIFLVCAWISGLHLREELAKRTVSDGQKSSFIVSLLTGIHTVKSLGLESLLLRRFEAKQDHVTADSYRVALAGGLAGTLSSAFGQLSLIFTATIGCTLVLDGNLSIGGLSACTLLAGRAIQPVQRVLGTWLRLQDLGIARKQAHDLLTLPVQDRKKMAPGTAAEGYLEINQLNFSYEDGKPLLKDISLRVSPGEIIAIQGQKGSGKSTLLQLICGLLKPQDGMILLDGIQPSSYSLSTLTRHVGYMPQEGCMFRGTILDNLTGFRNDDGSIEQARLAATELGLTKIINTLPQGYQTMLSDTAADPIPPGSKQRIALARVLAQHPSLILFDDADRALDKDGYNLLFRMMGKLKGRKTVIMITEDNNLMSFADRFYQIENQHLVPSQPNPSQNLSILIQPERDPS